MRSSLRSRCPYVLLGVVVCAATLLWVTRLLGEGAAGRASAKVETLLQRPVTLQVDNADLMGVIRAVGNAVPEMGQVVARRPKPVRVSFRVSKMPVEDVLRGAAGFAGCNLYVLPDRVVMAPDDQLLPQERSRVVRSHARTASSQPQRARERRQDAGR